MMLNINLLPWRAQRDLRRKQRFISALSTSASVGLLIVVLIFLHGHNALTYQKERNQFLKNKISILNGYLKKIDRLDNEKAMILDRMDVIQALQGKRPIIVHVFDSIVRATPKKVYLTSLIMHDNKISAVGRAESNHRISEFMRNLYRSKWFSNPDLSSVKVVDDAYFGEKSSQFNLSFLQILPVKKESDL